MGDDFADVDRLNCSLPFASISRDSLRRSASILILPCQTFNLKVKLLFLLMRWLSVREEHKRPDFEKKFSAFLLGRYTFKPQIIASGENCWRIYEGLLRTRLLDSNADTFFNWSLIQCRRADVELALIWTAVIHVLIKHMTGRHQLNNSSWVRIYKENPKSVRQWRVQDCLRVRGLLLLN